MRGPYNKVKVGFNSGFHPKTITIPRPGGKIRVKRPTFANSQST
jgi:hypothetical protein